jgi:hypothetical protein
MNRPARITLEFLGPPLVAATILEIVTVVSVRELAALKLFPLFLGFGYLVAGIPSLLFAGIMEFAFSRGLRPDGHGAVALAATLGTASGLPIDMAMAGSVTVRPSAAFFMILGFLVGGAIGLLIRAWSRSNSQTFRPGSPVR